MAKKTLCALLAIAGSVSAVPQFHGPGLGGMSYHPYPIKDPYSPANGVLDGPLPVKEAPHTRQYQPLFHQHDPNALHDYHTPIRRHISPAYGPHQGPFKPIPGPFPIGKDLHGGYGAGVPSPAHIPVSEPAFGPGGPFGPVAGPFDGSLQGPAYGPSAVGPVLGPAKSVDFQGPVQPAKDIGTSTVKNAVQKDIGFPGPQNVGFGGPQNVGFGGPQNVAFGGPQHLAFGGPQNIGYEGGPNGRNIGYQGAFPGPIGVPYNNGPFGGYPQQPFEVPAGKSLGGFAGQHKISEPFLTPISRFSGGYAYHRVPLALVEGGFIGHHFGSPVVHGIVKAGVPVSLAR